MVKQWNMKDRDEIFKAPRKKKKRSSSKDQGRLRADFPEATRGDREAGGLSSILQKSDCGPRILYAVKNPLRMRMK